MDQLGALIVLQKEIYKICTALVCITDIECCNYGFNDEVLTAKIYRRIRKGQSI